MENPNCNKCLKFNLTLTRNRQIDRHRQTDRQTERQTQTDRQTDTDKQTDKQTEKKDRHRQTDRQTERQTCPFHLRINNLTLIKPRLHSFGSITKQRYQMTLVPVTHYYQTTYT